MSHANPQPDVYEKAPEISASCQGCVGEHDGAICFSLPTGCSRERIIWVLVTPQTAQQAYTAALEQDIG